ncbi:MAG: class A beta-lactamase [Acidobacteria bacterium]|nr:class A beta-lactamase [Acidobacteriota bacterium]
MTLRRPLTLACWLLASSPAWAAGALDTRLAELALESGGTLGVVVRHVESGRTWEMNARGRFPMASVFKLPIAVAVLHEVEAGKLDLDESLEIPRGFVRPVGSIERDWKPGMKLPVRDVVRRMLVESDNTAADLFIAKLGGPAAVTKILKGLSILDVDISLAELDVFLLSSGAGPAPADGLCDPACIDARIAKVPQAERAKANAAFGFDERNTATPDALATLLTRLVKGDLLNDANRQWLLATLRANETGGRRLRALLPKGTVVGDKTGSHRGVATNDVGIVTLPGGKGHLVIAAFVKNSGKPTEVTEKVLAGVGKAAWDELVR